MTGSLPVSSLVIIPSHVNYMLLGLISESGTIKGAFINVGTSSAITTLTSEKAPKPTPFSAQSLKLCSDPLGKIVSLVKV